jgi:inner membrane protein
MASIFGHAIVGYTVSKIISNNNSKLLLVLAIASTILPDIDVLTFNFGIPYEAPFGHRGFTHSIFFAMLWATLVIFVFAKFNRVIWWLVMFLSTISHGILDAMTSGGRGVGFFIPFHNVRYFFPFREIIVSPIGIERFFSERGIRVIFSELKYVFLPCFLILVLFYFIRRNKYQKMK